LNIQLPVSLYIKVWNSIKSRQEIIWHWNEHAVMFISDTSSIQR